MKKERIIKLESNVDHLSGEEVGAALQALNDLPEVLDASYFSGIGKKNRPCGKFEVLCLRDCLDLVTEAVFRHTHTLGLRIMELERLVLPRNEGKLDLEDELVETKNYLLEGVQYQRPEADALISLAKKKKVGMPALRISRSKQ